MGQGARSNFVICTANDADFSLEILIAGQNCHIVNFLSTCDAKRVSTNACKLNLIRFEFAHGKNFVLAYFLSPRLLSKRMHLVRWVSEFVVTRTRALVHGSFTHVRADVKHKAYRISMERCPESAGVSCDAGVMLFSKTKPGYV